MKITKIISNLTSAVIVAVAVLILISVFPITGNHKVLVVKSGSMEPYIKTGSVVFVSPREEYNIGDVITFAGKGNTESSTTHRITGIENANGRRSFITKGDANNANDTNAASSENVIGKVLFSIPYLGYAVAAAKQPLGFTFLIIVPAALIIIEEVGKIRKELRRGE